MWRRLIPLFVVVAAVCGLAPGNTGATPTGSAGADATVLEPWVFEGPASGREPGAAGLPDRPGSTSGTLQDDPQPIYVTNQLLVRFKPGVSVEVKRQLHSAFGAQVVGEITSLDVQLLKLYDDAMAMVSPYQARDEVMFAEPNYLVEAYGQPDPGAPLLPSIPGEFPDSPDAPQAVPSDTYYSQQWHLAKIDAPRAWDYERGDGVVVAILDTGVYCQHPDLAGKCIQGYDYVNLDSDPADDHGHGTHVAGIAAAMTHNALGVAGGGWEASIMPVKALNAAGNGSHYAIASGIDYAIDHGADVINMSLGSFVTSGTLSAAVARAVNAGVTVVAAAGNAGVSNPTYPAAYSGVIGVAATTQSDSRASFSNYGDYVDVAAPGVGILSTVQGGSYQAWSGTSMASPVVAGIAALLVAQNPGRDTDDIKQILAATADDLGTPGWDSYYGAGRINAGEALAQGAGNVPTPGTPTATRTYGPPTATVTPSGDLVQQIEDLINQERARYAMGPLHTSAALRAAAARHSNNMAQGGFCSHTGSDGSSAYSRMRDAGYSRPYGEIVACGQTSPAAAVGAWMASSGHRAIILCETCTELGAGHGTGSFGYWNYWTVNFGSNPVQGATPTPAASWTPVATPTRGPPTQTPSPSPTPPGVPPGGTEVVLAPPNNRAGWVVSTRPDDNFFDDDDTFTGVYLDTRVYHGAFQFDLAPIPANAYINYARLELTGRSTQFLGDTGTWAVRFLSEDIDQGFAGHGYTDIHNAGASATLLPLLGAGDLGENVRNVFTLTPSQVGLLASRVSGSRLISFRMDGPTGGTSMNLFTWDTGFGPETRYPGPKLIVHYSTSAPSPPPPPTATGSPEPTEILPTATDGPAPTDTATPLPPTLTATAPPPPERTPTPTGIPTIQPGPSAIEIVPAHGDVGWVKSTEPGNHFGDADMFTGYYQGAIYHGAIQFDLSAIPDDTPILDARLIISGRDGRYLSRFGNGRWLAVVLERSSDIGWRGHDYGSLHGASTQTLLRPQMYQSDMDVGRSNTFVFDEDQIWFLRERVATTGKLSIRLDGPRSGVSNVFSWATGYGGGEPPRLSIVLGSPGGEDNPVPTPDPADVERVTKLIRRINAEREKAGVAPLVVSEELTVAAANHNIDMAMHDFFSHTGSDGSLPPERVARAGFDAIVADEVLAAANPDPDVVVDAWLARDQRDAVLDSRFTHVGAAYVFRTRTTYRHYWTVKLAQAAP